MTQTLSCMILNAPNSKVKDKEYFLMENLALLEDKILKDEQTFQETCRIYYNIQNLTENSTVFSKKNIFFLRVCKSASPHKTGAVRGRPREKTLKKF